MLKALFICNQNRHRSKTAEKVFKGRFMTKSAGLYNEKPVTAKQLEWADTIFVMEDFQRKELSKRFPNWYMKKRIISLNILDIYQYMQPELITALKESLDELL